MKHLVYFLLILVLFACRDSSVRTKEIVLGGYGSLTGTTAVFGQSTKKGIQLAIEQANRAGGILDKHLRLVMEDDQGKPEEAQTVVTKLITRDRVVAVIGENSSSRSLAAAPVCQQNRISMISPSSKNTQVTHDGDF